MRQMGQIGRMERERQRSGRSYRAAVFRGLLVAAAFLCCPGVAKGADGEEAVWIAVTAPGVRGAIEPLCARRRAEGMRVEVIETTDVLSGEQIAAGEAEALSERVREVCRGAGGRRYVLLVGAAVAEGAALAKRTVVPPLRGKSGRMAGQLTDNGYGCLGKGVLPEVAVGRLPARSAAEAEQMVEKTLRFERDRGAWQNRITLLVGHPGGTSVFERSLAEWFVQNAAATRFERLSPLWTGRILIHAPNSPFTVPDERLREKALGYLTEGQLFAGYLGHSGARGLWSGAARFLDGSDWGSLKIASGAGVLFSCGCFGCQLAGADGEGYGLAAMRNAEGPAAVIGAVGESYGAMGQLATDGLLDCLRKDEPPRRLGDYWMAVKGGLARGTIDPFTFQLYDQADGSGGKVPLARQRPEHVEMWILLGDPALRLPTPEAGIRLETAGACQAGETVTVRGQTEGAFSGAVVRVTLERPLGSAPAEGNLAADDSTEAGERIMALHARVNDLVLVRQEARAVDGRFECCMQLPEMLPWPRLAVRAQAEADGETVFGAMWIEF